MAIEYNVIPRKVMAGSEKGKTKYYAIANNTGMVTLDDLTRRIEKISSVNGIDVRSVLCSLLEVVPDYLQNGNVVELGEIGTFKINISSVGEDTKQKVNKNSIRYGKIVFIAGKKFKKILKSLTYKKKPPKTSS